MIPGPLQYPRHTWEVASFFPHLSRLLLRLDQSSAENPVERFRPIELYIRWMEESAAPEAPDSKVATTQLRNLGQNFYPPRLTVSRPRSGRFTAVLEDSIEHLELIIRVNKSDKRNGRITTIVHDADLMPIHR